MVRSDREVNEPIGRFGPTLTNNTASNCSESHEQRIGKEDSVQPIDVFVPASLQRRLITAKNTVQKLLSIRYSINNA
jgi:hypothetical protein